MFLAWTSYGLSPPVRGNHPKGAANPDCSGSIPACAGEPAVDVGNASSAAVYPRLCGGTGGVLARAVNQ